MNVKKGINVFEDVTALSKGFAELLQQLTSLYPTVNIALSGGSTPQAVFDYLSDHYQTTIPWERVNFFWGDERCVAPDDPMSNYGMTHRHLLSRIEAIQEKNVYRILGENEPDQEALRYGQLLTEKLSEKKDAPCFDLVVLGLGEDGHTASIFSDQIELWNDAANCVVVKHPDTGSKRVSITGRVINNALHVVFLVTGQKKAAKVQEILNKSALSSSYPASLVQPSHGSLYWFLDKEAAEKL